MDDRQAAAWRDLLDRVRLAHESGETLLSQAALISLGLQAGDEEPLRSWIDQTGADLGFEAPDLPALAARDGVLQALFEQSRKALLAGDAQLADAGFVAGQALAESRSEGKEILGWFRLGRVASLLAVGAGERAARMAVRALDSWQEAGEITQANAVFEQAIELTKLGRHRDADALWSRLQVGLDALPDSDAVRWKRARVRMNRAVNLKSFGAHEGSEELFEQAQQLLDALPDRNALRSDRAYVRSERAANLQRLGAHHSAKALYEQARELFDALPENETARSSRASIRMRQATNLQYLGAHEAAEALYRQAQKDFDALRDCDAERWNRAGVRMNRANNLKCLGAHEAAEVLYQDAQERFDALPDSDPVRSERACVRSNRAANLGDLGAQEAAEALFDQAHAIYHALPGSDTVRVCRAVVKANRLPTLMSLGRTSQAAMLCEQAVPCALELVTHESPEVAQQYALLSCALSRLCPASQSDVGTADAQAALPAERACELLLALCQAALDWLDLMARAVAGGQVAGSDDVALTIHTALSWLVGSGRSEQAASLLAEYHGRYASAQRLLLAGHGLQADPGEQASPAERSAWQASQLRLQLRDVAGRIQALETRLGQLRGSEQRADEIQALQQQLAVQQQLRLDCRDELLTLLRQSRESLERSAGTGLGVTAQRLQAALGPGGRALVVLMQVSDAEDPVQPIALVFTGQHGQLSSRAVALPEQMLQALRIGAAPGTSAMAPTRGVSNTRGPVQPPDGAALREAVLAGWSVIEPLLADVREVHVGVHHWLGQLPWQGVDDDSQHGRSLSVHHGIALALRALERGPAAAVAPPDDQRKLGVLAHTPQQRMELPGSKAMLGPIPGVHADRRATELVVGEHAQPLQGRQELLQAMSWLPMVQLSCHGQPRAAHTGLEEQHTAAYELVAQLEREHRRLQACILVACSTAQADENAWGEAGGWAAVMHDRCELVLGALHPVDDLCCTLLVLLLHRAWRETGDLKAALRQVRQRLRSGRWADTTEQLDQIQQQWEQALRAIPADDATLRTAHTMLNSRELLYEDDAPLRSLVEGFVAFG